MNGQEKEHGKLPQNAGNIAKARDVKEQGVHVLGVSYLSRESDEKLSGDPGYHHEVPGVLMLVLAFYLGAGCMPVIAAF